MLFGISVNDIAAHELIFSNTELNKDFYSLSDFFANNNYESFLTSCISTNNNEIDWNKIKNAYPFNKFFLFDDIPYKGKSLKFVGSRFTLPDEYALNYSYSKIDKSNPYFLFYSSTNSHYYYESPVKALENWNDYNTVDFDVVLKVEKNQTNNYFNAIHYQLEITYPILLKNKTQITPL